jgi:alkaline phosphatase D
VLNMPKHRAPRGLIAAAACLALVSAADAQPPAERPRTGRANRPARRRPRQYKQVGRALITQLARGRHAQVIESAEAYLEDSPGDLESMFLLAVAHARARRPEKAMGYVRKAVEAGLPIGRFLAGPRDLLRPLTEADAFRAFAAQHPAKPVHGPIVGSVTHERARFWVRTADEAKVQVVLGRGEDLAEPVESAVVQTRKDRDFTAVVEVAKLSPSTLYHYRVRVDGKPVAIEPAPSFRTFPRPGAKGRYRVGFGGGAGYTPRHERMWDTLTAQKLTAFLTLGDNVYIDTPKVPATQRYCYYRRQSRPEFRRFAARTPLFAIWDDHDFGTNDCLGSPGLEKPAWKMPVWRVFRENWANPAYGGGEKSPGVWFDATIGDVDFFLLDCRFYRTRPKGGTPTMLGPVQKRWFLDRLAASKATFKVLASSVPWSRGTKPGSKDTWDGYEKEREEIFSFIEARRVEGVFLISADRHRSDAWKTDRPNGYTLYEASSSKLTNIHTHGVIKGSLFGYNKKCSFGLLTFDTTKADPELTYQVINIDGKVIHTLSLKRSQLAFAKGG